MSKESLFLMLISQVLRVYVTEPEPSLSQGPFIMTAKVGETIKLTCHCISELESVSRHFWYKQRLSEAPKLIDSQSCQGDNCSFISKEGHSENVLMLEIRNVQVNDSGSYYCADKDVYEAIQNCPTLLVGDSSTNKTAVRVFVPPGELHLNEAVPLVCLVSGVSSNQIVIFWNISGLVTEGPSDLGTMEADGTYSIRSHVMVLRETCRIGGPCTCIVQLGSPGKYWTKSLSFPKATEAGAGRCDLAFSVVVTALVILVLLLLLISIWIRKSGRSGERDKRSHNEKFNLRERRQRERQNERQTDDHRQTEGKRPHWDTMQIQSGPIYASLDLAALDKRPKKKAGRR